MKWQRDGDAFLSRPPDRVLRSVLAAGRDEGLKIGSEDAARYDHGSWWQRRHQSINRFSIGSLP